MAVVNTKSSAITVMDAKTGMPSNALVGGKTLSQVGHVLIGATDSAASVYRFTRLPSNAVINNITVYNDSINDLTDPENPVVSDYDLGIYQIAENGGAVLSVACFATSLDFSSASTAGVNVQFEALNIDKIEKRLYEIAGLSTDTGLTYDICLTSNAAITVGGDVSIKITYSVG